ncbi:hypothetical protein BN970_03531 [Mycolicibacterium conceptionense]|uniref:Uncharacterized protein n=1 Tax=Mycolicibacterium conceptionense TaxID=451644 RepID=A0A0U1DIM3_9MYCO|nr:hypothetical protein BN970_03531 [Mycolicibacterium conceptionense]
MEQLLATVQTQAEKRRGGFEASSQHFSKFWRLC